MSPITHGMIGWIVGSGVQARKDRAMITAAALLPDFDGAGIVFGVEYYQKYHHIFGHNLLFGIFLSVICYKFGTEKLKTALLCFIAFNTHILGDLLGSGEGWGIPYLWPISEYAIEFAPPFQWSLSSWQNLLATMLCVIFIIRISLKKKRTIMELISLKVDKQLVEVFNKWFSKEK